MNNFVKDRDLAKRPTIHAFIARDLKIFSIEVDFMDLPATQNARRYSNARNYDFIGEFRKEGHVISEIFDMIPLSFSGHTTNVGQGDTDGAAFTNGASRPVYDTFWDPENQRLIMHEVMIAGSGNHRSQVEEVQNTRYVQHVKIRMLVLAI